MGAWIEINKPLRGTGHGNVAPFMGAWIEILIHFLFALFLQVAPFMGAWIEMSVTTSRMRVSSASHPSWVHGLKSHGGSALYGYLQVSPFMGKKNVNLL